MKITKKDGVEIAKKIVIEGTIAVLTYGVARAGMAYLTKGKEGLDNLTVDYLLYGDKK